MIRSLSKCLFVVAVVLSLPACGRVGPPLPPEMLTPDEVQELKVTGTQEGVSFAWSAPREDQRGKELRDLEGYRIYRKKISRPADILDKSIEFDRVTDIADIHLIELEKERDLLRAAGRPSHRARVDKSLTEFSYVDKGVTAGSTYVYKVVGMNQGGLDSDSFKLVKVLWRGDSSEITTVDTSTLSADDEFLGEIEE
ncbi:MAG: hypothetical protein J0M12_09180 [Deltaproteobacteria bacterium]|nr:hypothetical protein [Deltaproteobacteria bacterium]